MHVPSCLRRRGLAGQQTGLNRGEPPREQDPAMRTRDIVHTGSRHTWAAYGDPNAASTATMAVMAAERRIRCLAGWAPCMTGDLERSEIGNRIQCLTG
jgi:hypothetical protein